MLYRFIKTDKICNILFILVFFITNSAIAQEVNNNYINHIKPVEVSNQIIGEKEGSFFVDSRIKKELKTSIQNVYGKDRVDEIYNKLIEHAEKAIENRPQKLRQQDIKRNS